MPWNLGRTRNVFRRVRTRRVNTTRLRNVQSGLTLTLRDEIVVVRFWNRTFTLPAQATRGGTTWQ